MDENEAKATRREILDDIGALLHQSLAAEGWGRVLVEVAPGPDGEPVVSGIDVEEVIDDGPRIDEVFAGEDMHSLLPVLAKAVQALCALDQVDLEDVGGGTFVRLEGRRFAWLPALVHAPSVRLSRERQELVLKLREKNDALETRFGFPAGGRVEVDLAKEELVFSCPARPPLHARATLVGTFVPASRTWGWGASNPHAPAAVRRASASLVDTILDRDMWELSTPVFATDEPTAWALAALVCDRAQGDGVYCGRDDDGFVFLLVRGTGP